MQIYQTEMKNQEKPTFLIIIKFSCFVQNYERFN